MGKRRARSRSIAPPSASLLRAERAASRALSVPRVGLGPGEVPPGAASHARPPEGVALAPFDGEYDAARRDPPAGAYVLGQIGEPAASVSGFVPTCAACETAMAFVAQVEEGADESRFDFNATTAFAYACATCPAGAFFVDDFY